MYTPVDPHAISELYQHFLTAAIVLGPVLSALGIIALMGWRVSWNISRRLASIDYKLNTMWRAFCKQHNMDPNGGKEVN